MARTSKSSSYKKNSFSKSRQQRLIIKQLKQNTKSNNLNRNETERNEEIPKARRKSKSYTKNSFSELKQKRLIIKQLKQNTKNNNLNRDETERNDTSQTDTSSQNKTIWTQTPLVLTNNNIRSISYYTGRETNRYRYFNRVIYRSQKIITGRELK
ncbi:hypothetical protein RhiirA5_427068 [Rhizophagus irregularis]|uniref:Uncharacterized protein n=1 Tax=Rhizophagus irregularis TaxID=588596 RepID=A0A2N0P303_9GLOM|nr:hypothetical protein RhiirA5_427068 [Rhizophagus irregularis]PKC60480.1 hypothetical protein RhiirA1_467956 [Rhizophagus irregularis]PKC65038.1 hypothetical protein RhiirA1_461562 [Rhizophagus irregularis]CAB4488959.1 unnamed protein product [Rhizophagus irregularis]CAB5115236.1 unnamed protein product [Rhizophagus irregularis]